MIGLPGALFLVFLVLKLTNVITWSWWWVTAPIWGQAVLVLIYAAGIGAGMRKAAKPSPRNAMTRYSANIRNEPRRHR